MAQLSNAELSRVPKETPLYRAGRGIVQRLKVLEVIHDKYDGAGIDFSGVGLLWGAECDCIFLDKNEAYAYAVDQQISNQLSELKNALEAFIQAKRNVALPVSVYFNDLTGEENE